MSANAIAMAAQIILLAVLYAGLAEGRTDPGDKQALMDLKATVQPDTITAGSCLGTWDVNFDPCESAFSTYFTCGLRCDDEKRRVTELTLDSATYAGTIPDSLGRLTALRVLDISSNNFHGPIPASLANLKALTSLLLSNNALTGAIPPTLGRLTNLKRLSLDGNNLTGSLPAEIAQLQVLTDLELGYNGLTGPLPDMSAMRELRILEASGNRLGAFTGGLPPAIMELSLRKNRFSGNLPDPAGLKYLQVLDMSENDLSGVLPSSLFEHPALEQLTLAHNRFSRIHVPLLYGNNSMLIAVDLSHNRLRGPLPVFMGSMPRLSSLSLSDNLFTGAIPYQYTRPGLTPFSRLLLSGNYLFGEIPVAFKRGLPGDVNVSVADNCFYNCPPSLAVCQGAQQKTVDVCRSFSIDRRQSP